MFSAEQPAGDFPDPAMPTVLLYLAENGAKEAVFDWGAGRWRGTWRSSDLTLVPPNVASDVRLSERHSFFGLCLPVRMFADDAMTGCDATGTLGKLYAAPFRDSVVKELFMALWRDGHADKGGDSIFADSALQCLADRLRFLGRAAAPRQTRSRLRRSILKRIDDYIECHLTDAIRVTDLADIAGHSASHFTLLFKAATGRTPYRHVLTLRVERARELIIATPERGLADIAFATGFSSQSHMTAAFRQVLGRTPRGQD